MWGRIVVLGLISSFAESHSSIIYAVMLYDEPTEVEGSNGVKASLVITGTGSELADAIEVNQKLTELSEGIALRNVGAVDTDESVDEPEIPAPTPSASNEWKCVADRRLLEGEKKIIFTTYADGTPLNAKEVVVQLLCDTSSQKEINGYVAIQSTNNKTRSAYGPIQFEQNAVSSQNQRLDQMHLKASPMYMVAEIDRSVKCAIATPVNQQAQGGSIPFQIYEDIVSIELAPNEALTSAASYLKVYAR